MLRLGNTERVSVRREMANVFVFLGEDVWVVESACNVLNFYEIVLNLFSDGVLTNLNVFYAFLWYVVCPLGICSIVVVYDDGTVCVFFIYPKVFQDICYFLKGLCTFVYWSNFDFAGASCSVGLVFWTPGERATEPNDKARYWPGFEQIKLDTDWSCGPQLASVRGTMLAGSNGNWRKDSISALLQLENLIPRWLVPFR